MLFTYKRERERESKFSPQHPHNTQTTILIIVYVRILSKYFCIFASSTLTHLKLQLPPYVFLQIPLTVREEDAV